MTYLFRNIIFVFNFLFAFSFSRFLNLFAAVIDLVPDLLPVQKILRQDHRDTGNFYHGVEAGKCVEAGNFASSF